ncbi:peptidase [Cyanobium sp. PCC 7001]|uniref:peptidase n=1 Tax=Cyanobium sp. PCC 7001 TaxID=180281 RepID=UPI001CEC8A2C|nr:peptidase [Cyanobium sp. PCC 7001]
MLAAVAAPQQARAAQACPRLQQSLPVPPPEPGSRPGAPAAVQASDYRHRIRPTHLGWPRRDIWCVWIEPGASDGPAARWDRRWRQAVDAALNEWSSLLPIVVVDDPQRAQVQVLRRRPPLRGGRASHGRAELELWKVQRDERWALEPRVLVSISPAQRLEATQATALHELGHAFGLWGHSDVATDAMAAVPGAQPVLVLSARDRATLLWLQQQPALGAGSGAVRPPEPAQEQKRPGGGEGRPWRMDSGSDR